MGGAIHCLSRVPEFHKANASNDFLVSYRSILSWLGLMVCAPVIFHLLLVNTRLVWTWRRSSNPSNAFCLQHWPYSTSLYRRANSGLDQIWHHQRVDCETNLSYCICIALQTLTKYVPDPASALLLSLSERIMYFIAQASDVSQDEISSDAEGQAQGLVVFYRSIRLWK